MDNFPLSEKYVQEEKFLNALASAYRLQEAIISTTELSIISTTPEGIITSFNAAAERMFGYSAQEMIGNRTPYILHDPEEMIRQAEVVSRELNQKIDPGFDVLVAKARATRMADRHEWIYVRKDGTRFPVMLSVTALWDENDVLIGYAGIASDITEQRETNEKIKQSEAHLKALVNSLDDLVIEIDSAGNYINVWTQRDEILFGPRENLIDKTIFQVLDNELSDQYKAIIERVIATGQPEFLDYKIKKQKENRWRNAKFNFISPDHVLVCIRDITEQKEDELKLIKSEQKFRTLAENIPGIIYLCNNDSTYSMLYLNSKVRDITGYTEDEFISGRMNFVQLYHPEDAPRIFEAVDRALSKRESFHLTYRLANKSGEWRWVEEMGIGVYHDDALILIEGFINDITAQKLAEEELQKVADENYRIFNSIINLTVIAGFDGYFKRVNPSWTTLLGWSQEELCAKPFIEFVHPDDIDPTYQATVHITEGNNLQTFENRYQCKDGSYKWLLWGSASDTRRNLIYASAVDITERKKFEEELLISKKNLEAAADKLQKQNDQLNEFAHIISHNLRSPVGNIKTLISLIDEDSSKEEYAVIFEKLKNTSASLNDTLNDLLETLHIKKETYIEHSTLQFDEVLNKVKYDLEGEIIKCNATIYSDFKRCNEIVYPKTYLESIILNLLSNAIKYRSPDRPLKITVHTGIEKGKTVLRVQDNGLGIDLEQHGEKLFGLRKTFHEHKEARGVGLFLTKTQVETLGGTISAESEVNNGTTFIITF
ncbi:MAG TPA: PAS domain S-box protein [Cyclobacteriaceae bacterium]|jgi:PAS domain S-box-containing protein|nr:PAS domain S-box protein [Cyclobacteriaceae bacterium]